MQTHKYMVDPRAKISKPLLLIASIFLSKKLSVSKRSQEEKYVFIYLNNDSEVYMYV